MTEHLNARIFTCLLGLMIIAPAIVHAADQRGAPVAVSEAGEQAIYYDVQITGTVSSPRVARLSAATSGQVLQMAVDVGALVQAGDVLVELDSELSRLNLQTIEARAEQARHAVNDAKRRLTEARALVSQRSIAQTQVRDLEAEVVEDEAVYQESVAEVRHQRALIKRYTVKAPFAGVVSRKLTELGEWVAPGDAVLELVARRDMRVDFSVSEDYLGQVRKGSRLTFRPSASPSRVYEATVDTIVPVTDPGARTFLLRVQLEGDDDLLIPGMSVRASLRIPADRTGIVVPRDATLRYPDGRVTVWSVEQTDDGLKAREHLIETGHQFDGLVEVRAGLQQGAQVVVQGNESLQVGQKVYIREAGAARTD